MTLGKAYLDIDDFEKGLRALDGEMAGNHWLSAFAPITLIVAGGFLAVSFLGNRESTDDIDYLLEPQWAHDDDIKKPLHAAMEKVGRQLQFNGNWINEEMALFVTRSSRERLAREAERQNIVLWEGQHLRLIAAPIEWALERKLRRIHTRSWGRNTELDTDDALALLKYLRDQNGGPLDKEYIRTMNVNSFDVPPDIATMDRVALAFREKYNQDAFK